jgi:nickel superoxide dismutase
MSKRGVKRGWVTAFTAVIVLFSAATAFSHCEIPCGIYDDQMRVNMIAEHIKTIEKSMKYVKKLATEKPLNNNQLVRWIVNKEDHAEKLQEIVWQYFMTQRIKPEDENYTKKVTVLHKMLIYAMKCKQTTDVVHTATLRSLLDEFSKLYFSDHGHEHK